MPAAYFPTYEFVSASVGWAAVTNYSPHLRSFWIFRTIDGGKHWRKQFSGLVPPGQVAMRFFNQSDGMFFVSALLRSS